MAINSRAKGAAGEREVANWLKARGVQARRGQQFSGSPDSPDVVADLPGWHLEVKRTEALNPYTALEQAERDKDAEERPVVLHRRNGKRLLAIVDAEDWLRLAKAAGAFEQMLR